MGGGSSIRGRGSALEPTFSGRGGRNSAAESNLGGLTSGAPMEQVMTAEKNAQRIVGGPVKVPAIYELKNEHTLTELIKLAGGLSDTAFKGRVQVLRVQNHREMVMFEDDLSKVLTGSIRNVTLVDGDFVKIFPVPDLVERKVRLAGAVKTVGEFGLHDSMRIKDLIERMPGGLLMEANRRKPKSPGSPSPRKGRNLSSLHQPAPGHERLTPEDNILLKPNDYVFIRSVPDWTLYTLVKIEGEVKYPG